MEFVEISILEHITKTEFELGQISLLSTFILAKVSNLPYIKATHIALYD